MPTKDNYGNIEVTVLTCYSWLFIISLKRQEKWFTRLLTIRCHIQYRYNKVNNKLKNCHL